MKFSQNKLFQFADPMKFVTTDRNIKYKKCFFFPFQKKPALTKAERRAIQEAQRAAKAKAQAQAQSANKTAKSTTATATPSSAATTSSSNKTPKTPATLSEKVISKRTASKSPVKAVRFNDGNVKLFSHLEKPNTDANLFVNNTQIHPTVARLGEQYAKRTIVGSNARCLAFLNVIKMVKEKSIHTEYTQIHTQIQP